MLSLGGFRGFAIRLTIAMNKLGFIGWFIKFGRLALSEGTKESDEKKYANNAVVHFDCMLYLKYACQMNEGKAIYRVLC